VDSVKGTIRLPRSFLQLSSDSAAVTGHKHAKVSVLCRYIRHIHESLVNFTNTGRK